MIDPNELWIGDLLLLKKSKRIGKFAGIIDSNRIKVKIDDKIIISSVSNIEIAKQLPESPIYNTENVTSSNQSLEFLPIIDLHIEALNPSLLQAMPERIVTYQIAAAKRFIELAIHKKIYKIEIIHGKGEGVLKSEVLHLLKDYKEVNFHFDKNQGGSTEVLLSY